MILENPKPASCISLDDGTMAFMQWVCGADKNSKNNSLLVKEFCQNKYIVFYDRELSRYVIVMDKDGIPFCDCCKADDCGHVGFAICLKQYCDRNGTIDL